MNDQKFPTYNSLFRSLQQSADLSKEFSYLNEIKVSIAERLAVFKKQWTTNNNSNIRTKKNSTKKHIRAGLSSLIC